MSSVMAIDEVVDVIEERWPDAKQRLIELLSIESVSTDPSYADQCRNCAGKLASLFEEAGLENVTLIETGGHPIVYADWLNADSAPTVLIYGHYDVQPPDPIDEWQTPPFTPTEIDGNVYARGASDDKGQMLANFEAVAAWLAANGSLPVNVKFCIEGEEESGSVNLTDSLERHRELFSADVCLISDTHMVGEATPSLVAGLRGLAYFEIEVTGPAHDLHSGIYGGAVRNPAEELARIIALCRNDDGTVAIPGFYDDVIELGDDERADMKSVPWGADELIAETGVKKEWGETRYSTLERVSTRPTFELNGIYGGYSGPGAKTVIPAKAGAKVSMRLVPDQKSGRMKELLTEYIQRIADDGVSVEVRDLHGGEACVVDRTSTGVQAALRAISQTWGREPLMVRLGGGIPVVELVHRIFGIDTVLMGYGLPDDRLHSPNEKFSLAQFRKGIECSARFLAELAADN